MSTRSPLSIDAIPPDMSPGLVILQLLRARRIPQRRAAETLGMSTQNLTAILHHDRRLTARTCLRLSRLFPETSAAFWAELQHRAALAAEAEAERLRKLA